MQKDFCEISINNIFATALIDLTVHFTADKTALIFRSERFAFETENPENRIKSGFSGIEKERFSFIKISVLFWQSRIVLIQCTSVKCEMHKSISKCTTAKSKCTIQNRLFNLTPIRSFLTYRPSINRFQIFHRS